MDYLELCADLHGKQSFANDVLTAQLADIGFESFTFEERDYKAYIQKELYNAEIVKDTISGLGNMLGKIEFTINEVETKNWNIEWESQFDPVEVEDAILIKAPFHSIDSEKFKYTVIIEPKMSFGTGHHETTYLVLQTMLQLDFKYKTVTDAGCGTGVLGIIASMMGAKHVFGFDYDPLCVENTTENIEKNKIANMNVILGGIDCLADKKFDIILANINRNILTHNMHFFAQSLNIGGYLIMSGFYEQDMEIVKKQSLENNLKFVSFNSKNNWSTLLITK